MTNSPVPPTPTGGWSDVSQVEWYVERIGKLEARRQAEQVMIELFPPTPNRVLDLGCGDGRLAALALDNRPDLDEVVCIDRSPPMLDRARERFSGEPRVVVLEGDLGSPLDALGHFDLVVSGFAIHHLEDDAKQQLFSAIETQLNPGGVFVNLEVVASATPRRHEEWMAAVGRTQDDPEDRLAPVEDQLRWMRDAGLVEVECIWKWRAFALLAGESPRSSQH